MRKILLLMICLVPVLLQAQDRHFSAVNPALFSYSTDDVYIQQPQKYNNGKQLISPNPQLYPWEAKLENGMPNALVDPNGNLSIYLSSFIVYSPTPPSKVGVMVYTNNTNNLNSWTRPNANLYWYKASGTTADEKILPTHVAGSIPTNLVAVDIESLGIFNDGTTAAKPLKLIYVAQREFVYKYLTAYEMSRNVDSNGVLAGFTNMKADRLTAQKVFTFRNINADTHMNWLMQDGKYYFTSRVNSRRSALKPGEVPPFNPDPRKRFRRSTITEVGEQIVSKNTTFSTILEYSTKQWEPYSMQPFRLPGFEKDMWFGLVTMYGVEGYPEIETKQRTELAVSNNGKDWYYLKPGTPFLDNGTDPQADDHGCINIATPVYNTKFHAGRNANDPYFFYASSRIGHVEARNSGISLATSKYGKIAGLKATNEKIFYSMNPVTNPKIKANDMPLFSISNAFAIDAEFYPYILGDITSDPRGKTLTQLNSYVSVRLFTYNSANPHGLGAELGGTLGSSKTGTQYVSDEYIAVPFVSGGVNGTSKAKILKLIKSWSEAVPTKIFSIKDLPDIPVVVETRVKNATLYGIMFKGAANNSSTMNIESANEYKPDHNLWEFKPNQPILTDCFTKDFSTDLRFPNEAKPTQLESGSFAIKVNPGNSTTDQTIFKMFGDNENYITLDFTTDGAFRYRLVKEGTDYLNMRIAPPSGKIFQGNDVIITLEDVKQGDRKYDKSNNEETTIFRVKCASINFEKTISQAIIWNIKSNVPTAKDSCYARGYAYLPFTAFVGNMNKIVIGGSTESCANKFTGPIYQMEVAEKLPTGNNDFWDNTATRSILSSNSDMISNKGGKTNVYVYPNPVRRNGIVTVKILSEQEPTALIMLYTSMGKLVKQFDCPVSYGNCEIDCDLSGLSAGIYLMKIVRGNLISTHKIIVTN